MHARALVALVLVALAGCGEAERPAAPQPEPQPRPAAAAAQAPNAPPVTRGPSIPWRLADLSDDARTVAIDHEAPSCDGRAGRPQVTETARSVVIRVPRIRVRVPEGTFCNDALRSRTSRVRLASPLARRRLARPGGRPARLSRELGSPCPRLLRAPRDAPLFDVPRYAGLLAGCRRPVPAAVLALPILRRPPSAADALTRSEREEVVRQPFFLRAELSRAARVDRFEVRLVPGATRTCLFARFSRFSGAELECATSQAAGRRGIFAENVCEDRTPPRRVRVLGVAPPGVAEVRLTRRGRTVATAPVRDGVYAVVGDDPLRLRVGAAVLPLRGATTLC